MDKKWWKQYARAILPPAVLTVGLAMCLRTFGHGQGPGVRLAQVAALMASYTWLGWTEYRQILRRDELRRRLEMEAMMLAFIASVGIILALFFLRAFKLVQDRPDMVLMVQLGCYLAAQLLVRFRYRYWAP
jgi:hypothetical protein